MFLDLLFQQLILILIISQLASILFMQVVERFYNVRPPKVKLVKSWQVSTVISSLKTWDIACKLTLKLLTFTTVFFFAGSNVS